ncbi:acetyltransferase [Aureococcus anophagefferens]|nr:acetyltransferase [Aureococcus anophagefferens]
MRRCARRRAAPAAPRAVLRLDVGGELALPLGPDAAGDGALVVDVVEAHGLAAGGGCGDAACVAGVLLDGVRRLRESLAALDAADAPVLALDASSEPGARRAQRRRRPPTATLAGLAGIGASVCVGADDPRDGFAGAATCRAVAEEVAFDATLDRESGAHALRAFWYATDPATGAYWPGARVYESFRTAIGYPARVAVGRGTYGAEALEIFAYGGPEALDVGNFTSVGPNARVSVRVYLGGEHQWSWKTTFPFPAFSPAAAALVPRAHATSKGGVTIGSDVFIGAAATILSGVTVGDGAVVGAAAVVAKDVRPYAVVVGNPAREIKRRFDDATVDALLAERWWTWDDATVARAWRRPRRRR